jgi:hypothetical protein
LVFIETVFADGKSIPVVDVEAPLVDTSALPVTAGTVNVKSVAVDGVVSVTEPPPVEFSFTGILNHP